MVTMVKFYNFELQFVLLIKTIKNNVQTNLKNNTGGGGGGGGGVVKFGDNLYIFYFFRSLWWSQLNTE